MGLVLVQQQASAQYYQTIQEKERVKTENEHQRAVWTLLLLQWRDAEEDSL